MKTSGDHITQKQYLKNIFENKIFWIFYKDHGIYKWEISNNYNNKLFHYKGNNQKFNPERSGRGNNKILSDLEKQVSKIGIILKNEEILLEDHNFNIDYGIHILCKYDAPKKLDGYNINTKFEDNFLKIKNNCNLYFNKNHIKLINDLAKEKNEKFNVSFQDIIDGKIIYDKNYIILSENSIIYTENCMIYPISSNTLFCSHRNENEIINEIIKEISLSIYNWINLICLNANLYLVAHEDISEDIRDLIKKLYETNEFFFGRKYMIKIELGSKFEDGRGYIQNILTAPINHVAIITSKKGAVRSEHYHLHNSHYLYIISGSVMYFEKDLNGENIVEKKFETGEMFYTPPNKVHKVIAIEDTVMISLAPKSNMPDEHDTDTIKQEF